MKQHVPRPVFVTPHAMQQFRERVAPLSDEDIIAVIMASLQQAVPFCLAVRNHRLAPLYKLKWRDKRYLALVGPPVPDKGYAWPMVITILEPRMLPSRIIPYDGGEWTWQDAQQAKRTRKHRATRRRFESRRICSTGELR